jgi:type I site-specific restriction-modification system R (restriction) subunit
LDEVENEIKKIERKRIERAQEVLKKHEPLFQTKADRLKKIKGMVLTAVNRAINDRDAEAIKELKKLIDQLSDLLFY